MNRISRLTFILLLLFIFLPNSILLSANHSVEKTLNHTDKTYKISPLAKWTEQEKWVWKKLCEGKIANLSKHFNGSSDPKNHKGWKKEQKLSSEFLKTILLEDHFLRVLKNKKIRIYGAWLVK